MRMNSGIGGDLHHAGARGASRHPATGGVDVEKSVHGEPLIDRCGTKQLIGRAVKTV
jgi:hypothetical protein